MGSIVVSPNPSAAKIVVAVTMAASVTKIRLLRQDPEGAAQVVRYGDQIPSPGGKVTVEDFEAPLDVPVFYTAVQTVPAGSESATSATVTLASGGKSWLKDPGNPSLNYRITLLTSIPTLTRASRIGVFPIIDRVNPLVVTARRGGPTGTLTMHTSSDNERQMMMDLISKGNILLLQTPGAWGFGSKYLAVGEVTEDRVGVAQEPMRRWTLPFTVVDRPEGLGFQPTVSRLWSDVKGVYPTWADLTASGKTWDRLLQEGP